MVLTRDEPSKPGRCDASTWDSSAGAPPFGPGATDFSKSLPPQKAFGALEGLWLPEQSPLQLQLPVGLSSVSAGFPSPAEDYADRRLDINQFLVARPSSTFYFLVKGDSMLDFGIVDGDYLVCDRSVNAKHGDLVVAFVGGERLVKQLYQKRGKVRLVAGNVDYPTIDVVEGMEFEIWGVVTGRFGKVEALKRKR